MKPTLKPIIASLFFAALMIFSAILLKGRAAGYWVYASILVSWVYFFYKYNTNKKVCSA